MPAATKPGLGWGTIVSLHNGTALVALAQVKDCNIPESETDELQSTHYQSPDRYREFVSGLKTRGEFTVEMNYLPGSPTDVLCRAADAAADVRPLRIIVPNETGAGAQQIDFTGFVKGYTRGNDLDGLRMATLTVKVSGNLAEVAV